MKGLTLEMFTRDATQQGMIKEESPLHLGLF